MYIATADGCVGKAETIKEAFEDLEKLSGLIFKISEVVFYKAEEIKIKIVEDDED